MLGKHLFWRWIAIGVGLILCIGITTVWTLQSARDAPDYAPVILASGTHDDRTWAVVAWRSSTNSLCIGVESAPGLRALSAVEVQNARSGSGACGFDGRPGDGYSVESPLDWNSDSGPWVNAGPLPESARAYRIDGQTIAAHQLPTHNHLPRGRFWVDVSTGSGSSWESGTAGFPVDASGHRIAFQDFA